MNEQTLFKGLSLEVSNCFNIKQSALEEKFPLFIYFFFLIVNKKGKELKKTDRIISLRGRFVCFFVCLFFG